MRPVLWAVTAALAFPVAARADYHLISPYEIDYGELEIEHNGSMGMDHRRDMAGANSYTSEWGTGLTPWWHSEIEFGFNWDAGTGQPTLLTQLVTENMVELTEPGEADADFGFYFEYGQSMTHGSYATSNQTTFGPVVAKEWGRTVQTVNVLMTRQLGPDLTTHGLDLSYAWQNRWNVWGPLSPAMEVYGDMGVIGRTPDLSQQQLLVGPVGVGAVQFYSLGWGIAGKLKYEIGWLFGATPATAEGTLRWRVEVELPF